MSDMKDAVAAVRRETEEKVAALKATAEMKELINLHQSLNALEDYLKEPKTTLAELFGLGQEAPTTKSEQMAPSVRFDEFFGMGSLDAAKAYLRKQKDARLFQEIVDAIKAGGGKVDSEEKLRNGLSRSTLDVVKIGERYGWLEHYPEERARRWKGLKKSANEETKKDATTESGSEPLNHESRPPDQG